MKEGGTAVDDVCIIRAKEGIEEIDGPTRPEKNN
jgi:hypothetical protein